MTDAAPHRKPRSGAARAAVTRLQTVIRAELEEGWTSRAIYDRHVLPLDVIGYRQFCRYVQALRRPDLSANHAAHPQPAAGGEAPPSAAPPLANGDPSDVANRPLRRDPPARTFQHDPQERPGDYERLLGAPRRK